MLISSFLVLGGCSAGDSVAPNWKAPTTTATETAAISGSVTSTTASSTSSSAASRSLARSASNLNDYYRGADADPCANAPYSMYIIGTDVNIAEGTCSNGSFETPAISAGQEAVIEFTCTNGVQRCFAKAGDTGLLCNAVSDGVIGAFEDALDISLHDAQIYGKEISKLAASIVETAKNDTSGAETFKLDIANCKDTYAAGSNDRKNCYKDTIDSSPFFGQFKMMQTLATGWTVESLFVWLTDIAGFEIGFDAFINDQFATKMDTWFGTTFVADTRTFISNVITDQLAGSDTYPVKITCSYHYSKYQSGGRTIYDPVILTINGIQTASCKNDAALEKNEITEQMRDTLYAAMNSGGHGDVQLGSSACNTPNGWDTPGHFCVGKPELSVKAKYEEANRNDPEGTKMTDHGDKRISLIDVFPEVIAAIQTYCKGEHKACATFNEEGPPTIDFNNPTCESTFKAAMEPHKQYFAGVFGYYLYLKDPSAYVGEDGITKLSLDDLHKIFTHPDFLGTKLAAMAPGYNGKSIQLGNYSRWIPPLLRHADNKFMQNDIFKWDRASQISKEDAINAYGASSLPYKNSFGEFEKFPTSEAMYEKVFYDSHHEDWNPQGPRYNNVAGVQDSGIPIFAQHLSKKTGKAVDKEFSGDSAVNLLTSADISRLDITAGSTEGTFNLPSNFKYPYTLKDRGFQGTDKGRIFALSNRKTGRELRHGSKENLILEMKAGNGDFCTTSGEDGNVSDVKISFGWGTDARHEAATVMCKDLSGFMVTGRYRFFDGGQQEITETNNNGKKSNYKVNLVGRIVPVDSQTATKSICYFAPKNDYFSTDTQTKLTTMSDSNANLSADGIITAIGSAKVSTCDDTSYLSDNYDTYYLISMGRDTSSKDDLKAHLMNSSNKDRLQYRARANELSYQDLLISIKPSVLEAALDALGGTNLVAPTTAPTYAKHVKLLNEKHNAKFDPYCDDVNDNGFCDCSLPGTSTPIDNPELCNLYYAAAEPTISEPMYHAGQGEEKYINFLNTYGGKAGSELSGLTCAYLRTNQIHIPMERMLQCQHKVTGESDYRTPLYSRCDDLSQNHNGCPDANGGLTALTWTQGNSSGGGPVKIINPKPMKNTYNVEYPDTAIKLANYATKSIGQGVTIARNDRVFSFDEAMTLLKFRLDLTPNIDIYDPTGTNKVRNARVRFVSIRFGKDADGGKDLDLPSALLRYAKNPKEAE